MIKPTESDTKVKVGNNLVNDLTQEWEAISQAQKNQGGYFILRWVKIGTDKYEDIWITIESIQDKQVFDTLKARNNTLPTDDNERTLPENVRNALTGHVRAIEFHLHSTDKSVDDPLTKKIVQVYEGYRYQNRAPQ